jgi:hypothetical protein
MGELSSEFESVTLTLNKGRQKDEKKESGSLAIERALPSPSNFLSVGPARIVAIALACGLLANSLPSSRSTCSEDGVVSCLIDMQEESANA